MWGWLCRLGESTGTLRTRRIETLFASIDMAHIGTVQNTEAYVRATTKRFQLSKGTGDPLSRLLMCRWVLWPNDRHCGTFGKLGRNFRNADHT